MENETVLDGISFQSAITELVPQEVEETVEETGPTGLAKIFDITALRELLEGSEIKNKYDLIEKLQDLTDVKTFLESDYSLEKIEELMSFVSGFDLNGRSRYSSGTPQWLIDNLKKTNSANEPFYSVDGIDFI